MRTMGKKLTYLRFISCRFITYQNRNSQLVQIRILQKQNKENRLSFLQRGECNACCLYYNLEARGKHLVIQLLRTTARLLVTHFGTLIYLVNGFFFLYLVQLNQMRMLAKSKVLSCLSFVLIMWNKERRWIQDLFLFRQGFESFSLNLP